MCKDVSPDYYCEVNFNKPGAHLEVLIIKWTYLRLLLHASLLNKLWKKSSQIDLTQDCSNTVVENHPYRSHLITLSISKN